MENYIDSCQDKNIKSTCCRPNSLLEAGETVAEMAAMNRQEATPLK